MGNAESGNPIRNMDKRTARREYAEDFKAGIMNYRRRLGYIASEQKLTPSLIKKVNSQWEDGTIKVFVRKRPIFKHELESHEFDVISCMDEHIIVHDARMHNDMKKQYLHHYDFQFDYVFNEFSQNLFVYQVTTQPLVKIAARGGFSTALMYGQTGSGKTFTMSSIYEQAARDIFEILQHEVDRFQKAPTVSVSFIEISGDHASDLLNGFTPTQLRSSADGSVHAFPVTEPCVDNPDDLLALIHHGLHIRSTAATGVHDTSSRSHAILRIYIQRYDLKDGQCVEGTLTLVDLAGSEHRIDSMYHGKERRKETSNINASLMALKECIRARALGTVQSMGQHVFRKSKLTMALKSSFTSPIARTIVIATVSPASKDTEHSLNTLRHACIMNGQDESLKQESRFVSGGDVTTELIGEVNISQIARRNQLLKKQQGSIDELRTDNGNALESKASRSSNNEAEMTEKMKKKQQRISEARSFNALPANVKEILTASRKQLGFCSLQIRRIDSHGRMSDEIPPTIVEKDDEIEEDDDIPHPPLHIMHSDEYEQEEFEQSSPPPPAEPPRPTSANQMKAKSTPNKQAQQSAGNFDYLASKPSDKESSSRIPIKMIVSSIFIAKDVVPLEIMLMQLRAMLSIHNYTQQEIDNYIQKEILPNYGNGIKMSSQQPISSSRINVSSSIESNDQRAMTPRRLASSSAAASRSTLNQKSATKVPLSQQDSDASSINSTSNKPRANSAPRRPLSSSSSSITATVIGDGKQYDKGQGAIIISRKPINHVKANEEPLDDMYNPNVLNRNLLVEDKEMKKQQALAEAKKKIEQEALQRKERQEHAKKIREDAEQKKRDKVAIKHLKIVEPTEGPPSRRFTSTPHTPPAPSNGGSSGISPTTPQANKYNNPNIDHEDEIRKLSTILDEDRFALPENQLSIAKKFGIKRQIAMHKASVLRAQRKPTQGEDGMDDLMSGIDQKPQEEERPIVSKGQYTYPEENDTRGGGFQPSHEEDDNGDYLVSKYGRPLSNKMAKKLSGKPDMIF